MNDQFKHIAKKLCTGLVFLTILSMLATMVIDTLAVADSELAELVELELDLDDDQEELDEDDLDLYAAHLNFGHFYLQLSDGIDQFNVNIPTCLKTKVPTPPPDTV